MSSADGTLVRAALVALVIADVAPSLRVSEAAPGAAPSGAGSK